MKSVFKSRLLIPAVLAFAVAMKPVDPLPIGSKIPATDVKLTDVSGKIITLKNAVNKNGLLVMFSSNACPFVVKNQKRTIRIANLALKKQIGVVILNSNEAQRTGEDSFEEMKAYAAGQKYDWSYVLDKNSEVADAFGATRTPECFLFNSDRVLVYHGAIDNNAGDEDAVTREHLSMAIGEMLEGKPVSVPESKSVGCSIKRKK